jgi:predicted Rossmann-fold nucleotide-binding protein
MKGPMKGAMIGHTKQRIKNGRYVGITEPGIIAAEPPNPIVNELVILPDIEKRLEAFVRTGHGFVVFPGGVGTAEEILYLIGVLLHPCNAEVPFPLIFTGPESSAEYFQQIDQFIESALGQTAKQKYSIVINNPRKVAQIIKKGIFEVQRFREQNQDAFYFNWQLKVTHDLQIPFVPNHDNMSKLELHNDQPIHHLAANLRRAFSGIVTGNVKDEGIRAIEQQGPYRIKGNPAITQPLDKLLRSFVAQKRMKLAGEYKPCYEITT